MKYIETLREGDKLSDIYFCKHKTSAVTKNGKPYDNVILQDKTGQIDAKIWEPNSMGIDDFDAMDYVDVVGDVTCYNGALQVSIKRVRKVSEGEYDVKDYLPCTNKDVEEMYKELVSLIGSVKNIYLNRLLKNFFVENGDFVTKFKKHSAAKSVHHSFVGGLLEHTLSVTKMCDYYAKTYSAINRDLLLTAAMFHDMGKIYELSEFPINDYTDEGQLLGHIVMGVELIGAEIRKIDGFPTALANQLKHCILAHHGEYEYGSPKKPAIIEALALNMADNTDAKLQTMTELLNSSAHMEGNWIGFNRLFDSYIRKTTEN